MKIKLCLDNRSEGSEYMYRFCPKWLYNLHAFGELDEIDFFLENSEADVNMLVC
jgi:hypothetical protein